MNAIEIIITTGVSLLNFRQITHLNIEQLLLRPLICEQKIKYCEELNENTKKKKTLPLL